jgi:Exostosin family
MSTERFLTLYVNPAWKRDGVPSPLMFPFWGNPTPETNLFAKELFDTFSYDTSYYTITEEVQAADVVFLPYRYDWCLRRHKDLFAECKAFAMAHNLPLLVDGLGDGETPVGDDTTYVLRYGGYRFLTEDLSDWGLPPHIRWEKNRIEIPTQADDLLLRCADNTLTIRPKTEGKPVVGFAGMTWTTFKNMLGDRKREFPLYIRGLFDRRFFAMSNGIFWRRKALRVLKRSDKIVLNSKARHFFSGSAVSVKGSMKEVQQEFVQTILHSDYALDVRGYANASVRLYEILSLGRIPVIIDTERILPFADVVDYKSFSLIVDYRDIRKLPQIIADFHASLSDEQFQNMQRKAREAYVNHFRVDAHMPHIIDEFNRLRAQKG